MNWATCWNAVPISLFLITHSIQLSASLQFSLQKFLFVFKKSTCQLFKECSLIWIILIVSSCFLLCILSEILNCISYIGRHMMSRLSHYCLYLIWLRCLPDFSTVKLFFPFIINILWEDILKLSYSPTNAVTFASLDFCLTLTPSVWGGILHIAFSWGLEFFSYVIWQ